MAIACGMGYTLALGDRGLDVLTFGHNFVGQLGIGTREPQYMPVRVVGLDGLPDIVTVATGSVHSAALTSTGSVMLWGRNFSGQLGQGDEEDRAVPVSLGPPQFGGAPVAMVACGSGHTLVVTRAGCLFAFGRGGDGQLGLGDRSNRYVPVEVGQGRLRGAIVTYAATGSTHSGLVTVDGAVWTWGCGHRGRLGHNDLQDELLPRELEGQFGGARALSLAAGGVHTIVVTTCGAVWSCGGGYHGQLGVGSRADRHAPVRVGGEEAFGHAKVRMVACGYFYNVAVTEEGAVWSWGSGRGGKLGHNDDADRLAPARVGQEWFGGAKIVTADCGCCHSAAVSEDCALFTWGAGALNGVAQGLGHDDLNDKLVPTLVSPLRLLSTRIGRGLELVPENALAFAMGTHTRLGKESVVLRLSGPDSLLVMIIEYCRD